MDSNLVTGGSYLEIIKMFLNLGLGGVILLLAYFAKQKLDDASAKYETYINNILAQYREDMLDQRKMYDSNVELVKQYQSLAGDLKDIIIMNTTAMTKLVERIEKEVCK